MFKLAFYDFRTVNIRFDGSFYETECLTVQVISILECVEKSWLTGTSVYVFVMVIMINILKTLFYDHCRQGESRYIVIHHSP